MFWLIFTLVYLISFVIHIVIMYFECKKYSYGIGDIIDEMEFYMWCPVLNTFTIILLILGFIFGYLITLITDEL